ncbi:mannosyltransferase [Wenyingzhuangia sp. chi5]|uniref:Mannosyltransferase n=2 Tax=Wenyingzhuangia gilva TaxID=3057677 RepID=A0ABT8VU12_9FLAO|nr:mannosyltransferase [Wenyingzhuangia sp. chi5]
MTNKHALLVIFLSAITYYLFGYTTPRTDFNKVFTYYSLLFIGFGLLYKFSNLSIKWLIVGGILFRLVILLAIPNLSDDFYRFLWDGRALLNGINPYLILPKNNPELISNGIELYKGMGSMNGSHFTCYPPLNQFAFSIPAIISENGIFISTIVMRLTLIIADIISLYFGLKILDNLNIDKRKILLYFINPFIIIEITGNLHYEGMMIAFLSASIYYLLQNKNHLSASLWACSVSIKLIPLLFIPLLYKKLGFKNLFIYGAIVLGINVILFTPFLSQDLVNNFMSSIELYFQNFEFNASIYYVVREIGFWIKGYNIIGLVGKTTPFIIIGITILISLFRKNNQTETLLTSMLFLIISYYLLASVVHPWYIAIPLFLCIFTNYTFPVLWSFTIILSYSAYKNHNYKENLWLVFLEYVIVFVYFVFEAYKTKTNAETKHSKLPY